MSTSNSPACSLQIPLTPEARDAPEDIAASVERINRLIAQCEEEGIPSNKIVIAGFSQVCVCVCVCMCVCACVCVCVPVYASVSVSLSLSLSLSVSLSLAVCESGGGVTLSPSSCVLIQAFGCSCPLPKHHFLKVCLHVSACMCILVL